MKVSKIIVILIFLIGGSNASGQSNRNSSPDLNALTKAAQAEGEVTFYCSPAENACKRVVDGFRAFGGVKASFVRLSGVPLLQRYATEAAAGSFVADLIVVSRSAEAFDDGIKKGWFEPVTDAGVPVLRSGQYPRRFLRGPAAIVGILPWAIAYNTEKAGPNEIPHDWPDLIDPRWKGRILLSDPRSSESHLDIWTLILHKYGASFFTKLRAQNSKVYGSSVPAIQGLAAGEGALMIPLGGSGAVEDLKTKGAPLGASTPAFTTGVEICLVITARDKAKHPNASRLLAHYLMSPEGNRILNDDPGNISVYSAGGLPKDYQAPEPVLAGGREEIYKQLGF